MSTVNGTDVIRTHRTNLEAAGRHKRLSESAAYDAELLQDGMKPVTWLKSEAEKAGHSWRTVERAKSDLDVVAVKDGFAGPWQWGLPEQIESVTANSANPANADTEQKDGGLGENGHSKGNSGNDPHKAANSGVPSPHGSLGDKVVTDEFEEYEF